MKTLFYCSDPLNTVGRVMDTARRMGLGLNELTLARQAEDWYAVDFVLQDLPDHLARNFLSRIHGEYDLEPEPRDV